jgi:hypothetical protein
VANFATVAAGKKFNPHVTIGVAPEGYLNEMLAEPFEAFTFSPVGSAVYQLGSFGAARKELPGLIADAMSAGRRGSRCSARPRDWRPSRRKLAYRDRLDFRSRGQAAVRNGFTLASLCRCDVPSGDFGIGVVTQDSDTPLDKALWAEISACWAAEE